MGWSGRVGRAWRAWVAALPLVGLAACGGGGGGDSPGSITLSTHQLSFAAADFDSTPMAQNIVATVQGVSGTLYVRIEVSGDAVSVGEVVVTGSTTGQATVTPQNARLLGPGLHTATLLVYACTTDISCSSGQLSGSPQRVDVQYTVAGIVAGDSELTYTVGNTVADGDLSHEVSVDSYPDTNWAVAADAAWLVPVRTPGSGGAAPTLSAALDPAVVDTLDNGQYTGKITLTPTAGQALEIPVTLNVARTESSQVAPGTEVAGTTAEVTVRGENFDQVTVTGVRFGAVAASAFRVVSPTEIRATHPPLAAGSYPVSIDNAQNLGRHLAALTVVDPVAMPAVALDYPAAAYDWYPQGMAYDPARRALFVGVQLNDGLGTCYILRYTFDGAAWHGPAQQPVTLLKALAMSMDGQRLLSSAEDMVIRQHDPVSMAVLDTADPNWTYYHLSSLPQTSDGHVVAAMDTNQSGLSSAVKYSVRHAAFETLSLPGSDHSFYRGGSIGSLDGSTVLMGSVTDFYSSFQRYDASTGTLTTLQRTKQAYGMATDRTGSRFVLQYDTIYDRDLTPLGSLPAGLRAVAMSSDGSRVYALDAGNLLRTFALAGSGGSFTVTELGSGTALAADPGALPAMVLSRDDGTLFIQGKLRTLVQPVPH